VTIEFPDFAEMDDDEVAAHYLTRMLDGQWSHQTRALLQRFGTKLLDLNDNWAETSTLWQCPACQRDKPSIARMTPQGVLLCQLDEHHDHLRDQVEKLVKANRSNEGGEEISRRSAARLTVMSLCERFTPTIICADCNQADAKAKASIPTMERSFSFSPAEISIFIEPAPNRPHKVLIEKAEALWENLRADCTDRFDFASRMASRIARGKHEKEHHHGGIIVRDVRRELIMLSDLVSEAGGPKLRRLSLACDLSNRSRRTDGNASSTKPRRRKAVTPTRADFEASHIRARPDLWTRTGEDWTCHTCGRGKFAVLRKSSKGWTGNIHHIHTYTDEDNEHSLRRRAGIDDDERIFGAHEKLGICQDCRAILSEAAKIQPGTGPDAFPPEVLKELIGTPEAHLAHSIDKEAIRRAVLMNTRWAEAAKAYWHHVSDARAAYHGLGKIETYPPKQRQSIRDEVYFRWSIGQHGTFPTDRPSYEWLVEEGRRLIALEAREMARYSRKEEIRPS